MIKKASTKRCYLAFIVICSALSACVSMQTGNPLSGRQESESNSFQVNQTEDENLPIQQDKSAQIVILAQDSNNPISITTQLAYPKEMPIHFKEYSITPNRLNYQIHKGLQPSEAALQHEQQKLLLREWSQYFSAAIWDAAIKGQQQNYENAEQLFKRRLLGLPAGAGLEQLKKEHEADRLARQKAHQQQRLDLKAGLERKQQEIEAQLAQAYSANGGFSVQWSWPWDQNQQDKDCSGGLFIFCTLSAGWNALTAIPQLYADLGQVIGDAVNSLIWGENYSKEVKQLVNQAIDNAQSTISNFIPTARVSPSPISAPATPVYEYPGVSSEPEPNLEPPNQAAPWTNQTTVSNPAEVNQVPTDQMLWETLNFIQANRGRVEAFTVPLLARDIFNQLAAHEDFPLALNGVNKNKFAECAGAATSQLEQLYNLSDGPENVNNRCGVAFNNVFVHFPSLLQQATGLINTNEALPMPAFLKNHQYIQKINNKIQVLQDKASGKTRVMASMDGDMLTLFGYNQQTTGSLEDWLLNLLTKHYPEASTFAAQNKQAIKDFVSDKNIVFVIESPERCSQKAQTLIKAPDGFGEFGFGSFVSMMSSNNFIFDGEYSFKLAFNYKNSANGRDPKELHDLVVVKSPVAQYMNLSAPQLVERFQKKPSEVPYPLTMTQLLSNGTSLSNPDLFAIQVQNWTANYFDLKIDKVGNESCPPAYYAGCLNYRQATFKMSHRNYRTGIYRVSTRYSTVVDPKAEPKQADWDKNGSAEESKIAGINANYANHGEQYGYKFVALHIDYATFARVEAKPTYINLSTHFRSDSGLNTLAGFNGVANYSTTQSQAGLPDPGLKTGVALPNEPNESDFGSARVLKTVREGALRLQSASPSQLGLAPASHNMLLDLIDSHPDAPAPAAYDAFKGIRLRECMNDKYLQVGAVVNLTNQDYLNNQVLFAKGKFIPMLLRVKDSGGTVLRTWPFTAKIGSQTLYQVYWNGGSGQASSDSNASLTGLIPSDPVYNQGSYLVDVITDKQQLTSSYLFSLSSKQFGFDAEVTPPIVLDNSTQTQVTVDPSCDEADLSNVPDYDMTQETFDRLRQQMIETQQLLAPYIGLDISNQSDRNILVAEGFRVVGGYNTAQTLPTSFDSDIPTERVQRILKLMEQVNNKADYVQQYLTIIEENGGLNNSKNTPEGKQALKSLAKLVKDYKTLNKGLAQSTPYFLAEGAFNSVLRVMNIAYLAQYAAQPPEAISIQAHINKQYIAHTFEQLEIVHDQRMGLIRGKMAVLNDNIYLREAAVNISVKIKTDILEAWLKLFEFELTYHGNWYNELLADANAEMLESWALIDMARKLTVNVFNEFSKLDELVEPCMDASRKLDRAEGNTIPKTTTVFEQADGKDLKCRIDNLSQNQQVEKNHLKINLAIRKALLSAEEVEYPNTFIGLSLGDLKEKSVAFAVVLQNNKSYLIAAFSGENNFKPSELSDDKKELIIRSRILAQLLDNNALLNFKEIPESERLERIILAKEAKNLIPPDVYFPTIKAIEKNSVGNEAKIKIPIRNDAEIKILETAVRQFGSIEEITLFSDRVTCEYCQETIFHNNLEVLFYGQAAKKIKRIYAFGFPLYAGEKLEDRDVIKLLNYLKD
jgi:hypothetical protein